MKLVPCIFTALSLTILPVFSSLTPKNLPPLANLGRIPSLELSILTDSISTLSCSSGGFFPGSNTVIYNTPYKYSSVLPIISDFANLDYAAGPPQNIRLNGSENTVGTARFYDSPALPSGQLVEKLVVYSKSPTGPFHSVIAVDPFTVTIAPSSLNDKQVNVTLYSNYNAVTATPICHGIATQLNYTIHFCATDPGLAARISRRAHMEMGEGINRLLGNRSFSSCMQLQAEGGNGTFGYPGWGGGLFMGVGNDPSGEGAGWIKCFGIILVCSTLVVLGGGVFNY